jgi:hypothetical protein
MPKVELTSVAYDVIQGVTVLCIGKKGVAVNMFVTANRPRLVLESRVVVTGWEAVVRNGGNLRKSLCACRGLLSSDTVDVDWHVFGLAVCVCRTLVIRQYF